MAHLKIQTNFRSVQTSSICTYARAVTRYTEKMVYF